MLLTGLDARQVVWGKWLAVVRLMWRDYVRLGLLRVGCTVGLGALILTEPRLGLLQLEAVPQEWIVFRMLIAAVLVMAITLLNLFFTASVGVLAAFFTRSGAFGSSTAFLVRLGLLSVPVLIALFPVVIVMTSSEVTLHTPAYELLSLIGNWQLFLMDNGTLALAGLSNPLDSWVGGHTAVFVTGAVTYIGLTFVALRLCEVVAKRQGAA